MEDTQTGPHDHDSQNVMDRQYELAWNVFAELRKETVESQKIRAQVIGFKITLVSAGIGIVAAGLKDGIPKELLVIPAFAAIFFDFLLCSYSFSVKRIGLYVRTYVEPVLRSGAAWPVESERPLWEEFMVKAEVRQRFSMIGNLGITGLAALIGCISLLPSVSPPHLWSSWRSFCFFSCATWPPMHALAT